MDPRRRQALSSLLAAAPNTHNALTHMVPSMADAQNSTGKRTILGKDKGALAYAKFTASLHSTLLALHQDGVVTTATDPDRVRLQLLSVMVQFATAYPSWADAYRFGDDFFGRGMHPRLMVAIEEARSWIKYLDTPTITRKPPP